MDAEGEVLSTFEPCSNCKLPAECAARVLDAGKKILDVINADQKEFVTLVDAANGRKVSWTQFYYNSVITPLSEDYNCQHPMRTLISMIDEAAINGPTGVPSGQ